VRKVQRFHVRFSVRSVDSVIQTGACGTRWKAATIPTFVLNSFVRWEVVLPDAFWRSTRLPARSSNRISHTWLSVLAATTLLADAALAQTPQAAGDWMTYNRTLRGDRYSPLKEITAANVRKLKPVATFDTGETVSFQTGPVVVDGTMYFTTYLTALDADSGKIRWQVRTPHAAHQWGDADGWRSGVLRRSQRTVQRLRCAHGQASVEPHHRTAYWCRRGLLSSRRPPIRRGGGRDESPDLARPIGHGPHRDLPTSLIGAQRRLCRHA